VAERAKIATWPLANAAKTLPRTCLIEKGKFKMFFALKNIEIES
jgi:hypothetical protein